MSFYDYHENKPRGTISYPIEFAHIIAENEESELAHWHNDLEIVKITSGNITFHLNEKLVYAQAGEYVFIQPGVMHSIYTDGCECYYIIFDYKKFFKSNITYNYEMFDINNNSFLAQQVYKNKSDRVYKILDSIFEVAEKEGKGNQLIVQGLLAQCIGTIIADEKFAVISDYKAVNKKNVAKIKSAIEKITESYSEMLDLDILSQSADMSKKYFSEMFLKMTGKSPIEYLIDYRVEMAKLKIMNTNLSITEIALDCGFNDLSYFIKVFKSYFGITPKQFKKSINS